MGFYSNNTIKMSIPAWPPVSPLRIVSWECLTGLDTQCRVRIRLMNKIIRWLERNIVEDRSYTMDLRKGEKGGARKRKNKCGYHGWYCTKVKGEGAVGMDWTSLDLNMEVWLPVTASDLGRLHWNDSRDSNYFTNITALYLPTLALTVGPFHLGSLLYTLCGRSL